MSTLILRRELRHSRRCRASSDRSRASAATATRCCASSATTAAPRNAASASEYEGLTIRPKASTRPLPEALLDAARESWDRALALGERFGYRNAQVTSSRRRARSVSSWTANTTGIEPDFALVKYKKLAGGGYFKIINQSLPPR